MNLRKGAWRPISVSLFLGILGAYLILVLFYLLGPGGDMKEIALDPQKVFSFVLADPNLKQIVGILPFIVIGAFLYLLRSAIMATKMEDASDFGLHGTSRWGKPDEVINGKIFSKKNEYGRDPLKSFKMEPGIILGKVPKRRELLIMPGHTAVDNRNVLVIGSSGSGKGQAYVFPNMTNNRNETIICTDPKGEIFEATHQLKRDQGYQVYLIDFVNFLDGGHNPLDYIYDDEAARSVANTIAKNSLDDNKRDFWSEAAINYFAAILLFVKVEYKEKASMKQVIQLTTKAAKEEKFIDELLEAVGSNHPAYDMFALANTNSGNTRSGIMSTLSQQIAIFSMQKISRFTETSSFNFHDLQQEKSVLYIKMPMKGNPFVQITATFFEQLIDVFYKVADENHSRLPIDSIFLLDEFANIGKIAKYPDVLSTCRGLGMSMHTIVQDLGQLEDKTKGYGPELARTIINNHDTSLFLRTKDTKTAEYFSKVAGETTIRHKQKSSSHGKSDSKSISEQFTKRPLITQGELLNIRPDTCYLFVNGYFPLKLEKAYQFKVYGEFLFGKDRKPNYERSSREGYLKRYSLPVAADQLEAEVAVAEEVVDHQIDQDLTPAALDQIQEEEIETQMAELEAIAENEEPEEEISEEELNLLLGNNQEDQAIQGGDAEMSQIDRDFEEIEKMINEELNEDLIDQEALNDVVDMLIEEEKAKKEAKS